MAPLMAPKPIIPWVQACLCMGNGSRYTLNSVNPRNVIHSLLSQNHDVRMFVVQISLLLSHFSPLYHGLPLMHSTKEVNLHPCIAAHVNRVFFLFFFFLCHLLNLCAWFCHIVWKGQVGRNLVGRNKTQMDGEANNYHMISSRRRLECKKYVFVSFCATWIIAWNFHIHLVYPSSTKDEFT